MRAIHELLLATPFLLAAPAGAVNLIGALDTLGTAHDVAFANGRAYVADGSEGLRIIDVSNPAAPVELGSLDTPAPSNAFGVDVAGTHAFLADGFGGLRIIDVSVPAAPVLRASAPVTSFARDVAVVGNLAYVADLFAGLAIFDVSDPAAPVPVASFGGVGGSTSIAVSGTVAFLTSAGTLKSVDVSNPAAPVLLDASTPGVNVAYAVAAVGDTVFVVGGSFPNQVAVIDASQPADLKRIFTLLLTGSAASGIDIVGGVAFVATGSGVELVDISGGRMAPARGLAEAPTLGSPTQIDVVEGRVYVSNRNNGGLQIFGLAQPASPVPLGHTLDGQQVWGTDVVVSGATARAYAAEAATGLWVVDVSDPAAPTPLSLELTPAGAMDVDVVGNLAYVANGLAGLRVIDVSNPVDPTTLSAYNTPGFAEAIQVVGTRAYLADGNSAQVAILDVSNPSLPGSLGTLFTTGDAHDLVVIGDLVYVANGNAGLRIYNAGNPALQIDLGQLLLPDEGGVPQAATGIDVTDDLALLTTPTRLFLADVSDPSAPRLVTRVANAGGEDVARAAGLALVATGGSKLQVWDVTHPGGLGLRSLGSVAGLTGTGGIAADAITGLAVVADGSDGLRVVEGGAELAAHPCLDGLDDDGDGAIDFADAGCSGPDDPSERADCADGLDNDGDEQVDFPADPGCRNAGAASSERPQCQDGVDNDGDGAADFPADLLCQAVWDPDENGNPAPGCGLGPELALVLVASGCLRRSARGAPPRPARAA